MKGHFLTKNFSIYYLNKSFYQKLRSYHQLRKSILQVIHLWYVPVHYVRVVWIALHKVLMIVLSRVERFQWDHLSHNRFPEYPGTVELTDILFGDASLKLIGIKDRRTILGSFVRTLIVQLCGVVGYGKENFQKLPIADTGWVENHLD